MDRALRLVTLGSVDDPGLGAQFARNRRQKQTGVAGITATAGFTFVFGVPRMNCACLESSP